MSQPLSILFTIPNFLTAGSGRVLLNIAERLDRDRFAPSICVAKLGGALARRAEDLGIPVFEAPFTVSARPCWSLPARLVRAARPFRGRGYSLWHSFHYNDNYTEPLIARIAGARTWVYTKKAMGWGSRGWWLRSQLASGIVADNSEMPRLMFDRALLREKVRVIHHGVPPDEYAPDPRAREEVRRRLGYSDGQVLVGCVAHLLPVKRQDLLIRAAAATPGVEVVLAGRPADLDYATHLGRLAEELGVSGRVRFLGGVDDVPALLSALDIFVLPSQKEGCPVALLEAFGCGLACIASDIPGSRDIIESGRCGRLVPPDDDGSLAAALRELSASRGLRDALGRAARERLVDHFSIGKEFLAHESLYDELLSH